MYHLFNLPIRHFMMPREAVEIALSPQDFNGPRQVLLFKLAVLFRHLLEP